MIAATHDNRWAARNDHRPTRENRVSRHNPCAWCDDTKYCLQFDDGASFCRTVGDANQWTDAYMGGYLHQATDTTTTPPSPKAPDVETADADTLHAVYTALLALCPLSEAHRVLLTGPGHGLDAYQVGRYGTLPVDSTARREIVNSLITTHGTATLLHVPGFILNESGRIALAPLAGILMPRRDLQGRLTGCMVRSDKPDADARYLWLSSAGVGGPSSGSAPHIAQPSELRDARTVYIVEGIKKADLLAERMGCLVISINGVGTWRAAEEVLDELATRGVDTCVITLDRDVKPSAVEHVERSGQRLAAAAVARGYAVRIASWDKDLAKGPDDLLLAGHAFAIERYRPAAPTRGDDDGAAPIAGVAPATDGSGWITIDPELLALLIEKSMATDTLRRKYQQQNLLITDKRLKPGDKVLAAAVWDMAMPDGHERGPAAPRKIYRAALAERTGMSVSTISRKLQDANAMGLIACESRQTGPDNTELWVSVGRLPDKALSAEDVNALAQNRQKDRERKGCPNCGGTHLKPATYICTNCHQTCTNDEALAAGRDTITTDAGAIINTQTGEILTPAPTRAESARGQTTTSAASPTPYSEATSNPIEAQTTPRADSAHHTATLEYLWCAELRGGQRRPEPDDGRGDVSEDLSADRLSGLASTSPWPQTEDLKSCQGGCGSLTHRGWTCKHCRERPPTVLHIPDSTAPWQEAPNGR